MSFSLRLTADLTLARVARAIGAKSGSQLIQQICVDELFGSYSTPAAIPELIRFRAPIVWVTGSDALDYPQTASFTNSLATTNRHVFLETSGMALKPRLHEFQPSPNFCFVIRFDSAKSAHDQRIGLEALRMARLAGFYCCARVVLQLGFSPTHLNKLHDQLRGCDIDGILVTSADSNVELVKQTAALRGRWLNQSCRILCSFLEDSMASSRLQPSTSSVHTPHLERQNESLGEEVKAG